MVTPSVVVQQTARTPLKEQQSKQRRPVSSLPNNNKRSNRRNNNRTDVLDSDDSSDSESNDNDDNNIIMANDDDTARTWPPHARSERDEDRTNEELRRMERMVERRMENEIESLREMDRHFSGGGSRTAGLNNNTHFSGSSSSRSKYCNDDETTIYGGGSTDGDLGDLLLDGDTAGGSQHLLDASYDADLNDLLDHNNGGGGGSKIISDSSDDDDDDDEDEEDGRLMNPYTVMNPPLLRALEYETVASSVELSSSITTKKKQQQQQRPGRSPTPVMSNISPRHSTTANHPLSVFDPYHSPTPSQQHSDMKKKKKQQQKQLHPLSSSHHHQHGGLEMEDSVSSSSVDSSSEIIDFVQGEDGFIRSTSSSSKKSASYYPIQEERFETLPQLPTGQWSDNYYPRRDIEESTSFSPFPKQQQHQQQQQRQQHDWRGEPTTSRGTIPPRYYGYGGGHIPNTIISTLSEVAQSMISSAAYYGTLVVHAVTTNSFVYGTDESDDDPRQHQRRQQQQQRGGGGGGSSNNNPFQHQNQQYRRPTSLGGIQYQLQNKMRGRRRRSWMTITNIRILLIMSIVLLCLRNLTSMIHHTSSHDDNSSITTSNNNPTDISLKIKEAKRHWWNKKNKNDSASGTTTSSQADTKEVHVNGKKTNEDDNGISQSAAASTTTDGDSSSVVIDGVGGNGNNNDSSPSTNAGSGGSVVVQTREDGTILIKLPAPHMHLEQPDVTAAVSAMIDEQQHPSYTLDGLNGGGDDETMYIKLPYSPPQQQQKPEQLILHDTREDENDGNINHVLVDLWKNDKGSSISTSPGGDDLRAAYQDYLTETKKYSIPTTEGTTLTKREIEPPLRGAAPQEFVSVSKEEEHVGLRKFSRPLPLVEDEVEHHISAFGAIKHHHTNKGRRHADDGGRMLHELRNEFDTWASRHSKTYATKHEKEHRFNIWMMNHNRIAEKNKKHGPCRMTGKAVFGHNLFSDMDPIEFQSKFLTGYHGPRHNSSGHVNDQEDDGTGSITTRHSYFRETAASPEEAPMSVHPDIQRQLEEHVMMFGANSFTKGSNSQLHGMKFQANYASSSCHWYDAACFLDNLTTYKIGFLNGCKWWDVSCSLRYIFGYQYVGGTREPTYDENSYPSALDWRAMGVVTDVHSQGSCGACWAITAVETIESAYAISTGQLVDLNEEEVIACDGTCEMCNGGWPQNAYEYVMKYGGLPAQSSNYNADFLYQITAVLAGESNSVSDYEISSYFASTCPAGKRESSNGNGGGNSHKSGDNNANYDSSSYVSQTRYGKIKGYGYATNRCVCYTDGSGCDCDNQNEKTAVLNVATYGPAAVCLEASTWQNYEGGIMTSDIGCSKAFTDMNHCVEVVGYAFTDESSDGDQAGGGSQDRNGGQDHKSGGSKDGGNQRSGYWIVKNQWSSYWGMSGYAYVAMGANTCGILNDMTQVYMK